MIYAIIKETNGKNTEYSVIDTRTYKTELRCTNLEDCNIYINVLKKRLYQGSGVQGNEVTL